MNKTLAAAAAAATVTFATVAFNVQETRADGLFETISKPILWAAIRSEIENIMDDENAKNPGVDNFPGNSGGGGDIGSGRGGG